MQRELQGLRTAKEKFVIQTRELELNNDDLERIERATKSSLQDLESKYNKAIERNVLLENELEGKNQLIVQVQRLKDELRDVHIELAIMKNKEDGELGPPTTTTVQRHQDSRPGSAMSLDIPPPPSPTLGTNPHSNPVLMVQEMVGRVKSLEARLVSCRSLVTPLLAPPPSYSTTPLSPTTLSNHSPSITSSPAKHRSSSPYRSPTKSKRSSKKAYGMMHTQMMNIPLYQV